MTPTPEQLAINTAFTTTDQNLMIHAYAGCGKSTQLRMLSTLTDPNASCLALAFNKKIADELKRKFPPHFAIMTFNGLGHRAWGNAISKRLTLDDRKTGRLVNSVLKGHKLEKSEDSWTIIRKLIGSAQHAGLIPKAFPHKGLCADSDEVWQDLADDALLLVEDDHIALAREALTLSIREAFNGLINYDDQVYMSALFGGSFPHYSLVMADEAQDLSPLNHRQLAKLGSGRLVIVGDEKQAIYSFRGAAGDSMDRIRQLRPEASWTDLPLATTFRCPKVIVDSQQYHAPGFVAAETNAEGQILNWSKPKRGWSFADIKPLTGTSDIAFLCRTNAPLLRLAFKLLADGVGCSMLGRDIGKNLEALSKKVLPSDDLPIVDCIERINAWASQQIAIATSNGHDAKVAGIEDRRDSLLAIAESSMGQRAPANAGELRERLRYLFSKDSCRVVLSTGHRGKGLEWPLVVHVDPWRIPSKYAKRAFANGNALPLRQERNLGYIVATRAIQTLVLADVELYGQTTITQGDLNDDHQPA